MTGMTNGMMPLVMKRKALFARRSLLVVSNEECVQKTISITELMTLHRGPCYELKYLFFTKVLTVDGRITPHGPLAQNRVQTKPLET